MCYKKRGDLSSIESILAKLEGKRETYKPMKYSNSDIQAAKGILSNLLLKAERNEVSYIRDRKLQIEE